MREHDRKALRVIHRLHLLNSQAVNIRMPSAMRQRLAKAAERFDMSQAEYIRQAVEERMERDANIP